MNSLWHASCILAAHFPVGLSIRNFWLLEHFPQLAVFQQFETGSRLDVLSAPVEVEAKKTVASSNDFAIYKLSGKIIWPSGEPSTSVSRFVNALYIHPFPCKSTLHNLSHCPYSWHRMLQSFPSRLVEGFSFHLCSFSFDLDSI